MIKIAITGTIGSGKTECSRIIEDLGYSVFNCDERVNQLYLEDDKRIQELKSIFPTSYQKGKWNKKEIANEIFQDSLKKEKLEAVIYPVLLDEMKEAMKIEKDIFIAEVPLLFQIGWDQYFDEILVVTCDDEVAIQRLVTKRGMSELDAKRRLLHQQKNPIKIERATKIIYNNTNVLDLKKQVEMWLDKEIIKDGVKR